MAYLDAMRGGGYVLELSADAIFLKNILPGQRFVFSIRHPYDVVLSCFRQSFVHNAAMENFNTIAEASALYHVLAHRVGD